MVGPRSRFGLVADFAGLAKRISGWTTNLMATAIVLVGGLALGWQVLAWWRDQPAAVEGQEAALSAANLPLGREGQEFWTRSGLLKVERVAGSASDALFAMQKLCRASPPAGPLTTPGAAEEQLVAQLASQTPLEETSDLTLYRPQGETSMVVAVSRDTRRIVGWSFALPAGEGTWTIYQFEPHGQVQSPKPKVQSQSRGSQSSTFDLGPWTLDSTDLPSRERNL